MLRMQKSFELFDNAFADSVLDDLGRLSSEASAMAVSALVCSTCWWSSDTSATVHVPSFADHGLTNDALEGAVWAALFCSLDEPRRTLSLRSKFNDGQTSVSSNTVVIPLRRNCLVLFDAASLTAEVIPAPSHDETGLWLIRASCPSGEPQ